MKILNFGIPEIILILVVMIIFLGPEQIVDMSAKLGRGIRKVTHSEIWMSIWQTSREIRNIPKTLVNETGLEESLADIQKTGLDIKRDVSEAQSDIQNVPIVPPEEELDSTTAALKKAGYIAPKPTTETSDLPTTEHVPPKPQEIPTLLKKK